MLRFLDSLSLGALALLLLVPAAGADEGMWLFTNPPRKQLKQKFGFEITDAWLAHVQRASVRFNSGGSGSFVSPDGLVMTNHHVGLGTLQQISTKDRDYVKLGFHAETREQEVKAKHLELNVLLSIEDVTTRVNAAVKPTMSAGEAFAARRGMIAQIEKQSLDATKLRSDVVTLYQGGQYHLYRYKKYTDVRLVFAPEQQIAFFGGDPDNFEYPRYDLDICFFRVYEDGKPAKIEHYLKWSQAGAQAGEPIFVSGHPGSTQRSLTLAELDSQRDRISPFVLQLLYRLEVAYLAYSARSEENARRAKEELFSVQNSRKAYEGGMAGLLDPPLLTQKEAQERKLREETAMRSELKDVVPAWDRIAEAQTVRGKHSIPFNMLERARGFNSRLFEIARTLLRAAEEKPKPNGERLSEFRDSGLQSLEEELFSEEPIYLDFEAVKLAASLTWLANLMGADNELVRKVLAGKSPSERAVELIEGTSLRDVAMRKKLYQGGKAAVNEAKDPMIELARLIDPEARAVRKIVEAQEEIKRQAHALIARARFALEGTNTYPDATFTLRLSYGVVKGYEDNGKQIPFETTFAGLFERSAEHHNKPPFDLPPRWLEAKSKLDLSTPLNFVCTADIIGGNSGSPVINREAEVVGLIFDGNIQSLVLAFAYTEQQARAVAVHSRGIVEALRKVYGANQLATELTGHQE
jgi:hypothetical protein